MLHKIPVFTHILCPVLTFLCLCGFLYGAAEPTLALPDSAEGDGAGAWSIRLSVSDAATAAAVTLALSGSLPPDTDPSTPAAVCVTVDASDGWHLLSAVQGKGENESSPADTSVTLTVDIRDTRAVILADGELKDLAGLTILLTLDVDGEACGRSITAACPEGIAYYDPTRGGVDYIPVAEARAAPGTGDGAGQGTDTATHEAATDERADEPTETAELSKSEQDEPDAAARLIGCQETPCANGFFSVRFIYEIDGGGAGQGSPPAAGVVCLAGRGVISVEVTSADSVTGWVDGARVVTPAAETAVAHTYFLLVTFRRLSARGAWVFTAERGDGTRMLARWQDGQFMGWTEG